ncbi:MAG: hypothetical protein K5681_01690 [Treponema sp.]|nr:hypothetical protein [Treponema sp.]
MLAQAVERRQSPLTDVKIMLNHYCHRGTALWLEWLSIIGNQVKHCSGKGALRRQIPCATAVGGDFLCWFSEVFRQIVWRFEKIP